MYKQIWCKSKYLEYKSVFCKYNLQLPHDVRYIPSNFSDKNMVTIHYEEWYIARLFAVDEVLVG